MVKIAEHWKPLPFITFSKMDNKEETYLKEKSHGNAAFKEQNYMLAIEHYTTAIQVLEPNHEETSTLIDENVEDVTLHSHQHAHALAILYSNRAQAQLKLENYGLAIHDCTLSLDHDSHFVKSVYRRAVANFAIRELESALKDCKLALTMAPNDSKIRMLSKEVSLILKQRRFEMAIDVVEKSVFTSIKWEKGGELQVEVTDAAGGEVNVRGLDEGFIERMIEAFKKGLNIDKMDAFAIVNGANTIFKREKSLVEFGFSDSTVEGYKKFGKEVEVITICGDTHGQVYDVFNIFELFGKVSSKHVYLFNGDFVDRGSWGCEVALLLYSLKILYPDRLFINRGNHETDDMNSVYGFQDECKYKYGEKLFKCFSESFGSLPYCTLINNEWLVMHGGLFSEDNVGLAELRKIDRFKNTHGQPPRSGIEMELLWTDPQESEGRSLSKRGVGLQFGPDVTKAFCDRNHLKGVIRSHEVRDRGVEWEHGGKLCTVFSAPNYCDVQGNLGGVINMKMNWETMELAVECERFSAVEHPDVPPMKYTKNQYGF